MQEPAQSTSDVQGVTTFRADYAPPDEEIAARFLAEAGDPEAGRRTQARAARLVTAIRARSAGFGGVDDLLHEFSLSTKEGLALMVLAEALLRVPDDATADRLIEDKLKAADFAAHEVHSGSLLVSASAWALGASARIVAAHETPEGILAGIAKRLGQPAIRSAIRQAMRLLGSHFVLGQTIEEALARAAAHPDARYSFDMLGEGARTGRDAERYFNAYADAIRAIGAGIGKSLPSRPGISVKLSALHPRYESISRQRVRTELAPKVLALAEAAKAHGLAFTVDAEEADRLELSLDIVARVLAAPALAGWTGFGVAVQAYQKRACAVVDWLIATATSLDRQITVRLVKGAYWDIEVKRAQERGLPDYPVFTRKAMTDLSFVACARKLLAARPRIYPQFATHNALTMASVIEAAGSVEGYEFQRLHGMGEALFAALRADEPGFTPGVYAPVGTHSDLLAYLVRRLLENGANTSFVSIASDPSVPLDAVLTPPQHWIARAGEARHPNIPLPQDLYAPARRNSHGVEFGDAQSLDRLLADITPPTDAAAAPIVGGVSLPGRSRPVISPIDGAAIGAVIEGDEAIVISAMADAQAGFPQWAATRVDRRAAVLVRAGDLIEGDRGMLIGLLQVEGGKTLDDCVSEIREAADYCRYYATEAVHAFAPQTMPGPTGESNVLSCRARGVFVCISPWNFPLAIFAGQIVAALAAGNAVVAKPAEQTPLVAAATIRLLHEAGVPKTALHLVPGDGRVGAMLVADPRVAGVAFTGSTEVARLINRALAAKDAPIVPLIAETGGINAMIVDATALPEQVTDDVTTSAFRSAGQRCSALRLLCVQDDVADRILDMVIGAGRELAIGDPRAVATHIGPVIDAESRDKLEQWISGMEVQGRVRFRGELPAALSPTGFFVPPVVIELDRARDLKQEVFGPVLHVVRYRADELDQLLADIAGGGHALTLGIQSRIDTTIAQIVARLGHGNVYVNRSMIGAVVGTQPFGGHGLSGTGPKAGGPNYLHRFAVEQTVTVNTAASGGNVGLLAESGNELNKRST